MAVGITYDELIGLPQAEIIESLDYEAILDEYVTRFRLLWPTWDAYTVETDPIMMALEVGAYRETIIRARMNDVARANLLRYAQGTDLDQLAGFYDLIRLEGETDIRFRKRLVLAIQGRSTGGTVPRYRLIAMSADVRIKDVSIWRAPNSPVVRVSILNEVNDGIAYPEMIAAVRLALEAEDVRMVNDDFVIENAAQTIVNVTANVWFLPNATTSIDDVEEQLRASWDAESGLGFDLTISWLISRMMIPGVQKVTVTAPLLDQVVTYQYAVSLGTITLTDMGRNY